MNLVILIEKRTKCHSSGGNLSLYLFINRVIKLTAAILEE
jgi:hypothetical protein